MQKQNKEGNDFNKSCLNQDDNYYSKSCLNQDDNNRNNCIYEKKNIIYLIIIALLLFYCSLFFIHYVHIRGNKKDKELLEMEYNDKDNENNPNNNTVDNNIISGNNNITNGNNNIINGIIGGNNTNTNIWENNNTTTPNGTENNPGGETDKPAEGTNTPGGETSKPGEGTNIPDEEIVNNKDRFKVMQGSKEWKELKSLNIFNNYYFNGNSIIAPNVQGKYSFTVENYKDAKIQYNLRFTENNAYNINMVYKLKLNELYIAGNENTFVKYKDLNINNIIINKHTRDVLTLEWKWLDSDNDTQIGKTQGADYKINIEVNASELDN